jgi:hypothetical protein
MSSGSSGVADLETHMPGVGVGLGGGGSVESGLYFQHHKAFRKDAYTNKNLSSYLFFLILKK